MSSEPIVIPALHEWHATAASPFCYDAPTIIVDNDTLLDVAETFADDLETLFQARPDVRSGSPEAGDIVLTLEDQGQGDESYALRVDAILTIAGTTARGVFNGTRSALQLLHQAREIPAGDARDWPEYPVRSTLFDHMFRHLPRSWWGNFFRQMSYLKLNDTTIYLDALGVTRDEMRELDQLAAKYFIKIVPQINMPSHMAVLLPSEPKFQLVNTDGSKDHQVLDLTNRAAWDWTFSLIDDHIDLFSGDEWHIGTDEFPGWPGTGEKHPHLTEHAKQQYGDDAAFADLFADYQNVAAQHVRSHGRHPRVWNDMIRESKVVRLDKDVTVEYWVSDDALPGLKSASTLAAEGYKLINAHVGKLYYDQSKRNLDPREIYDDHEVTTFAHGDEVPRESVLGARLAVWLEWINTPMESDAEVLANVLPSLASHAQKVWRSPKPAEDFAGFLPMIDAIGHAPGWQDTSANRILPNPAVARAADGAVAFFAVDEEGQLWFGRETTPGESHFRPTVIGRLAATTTLRVLRAETLADGRLAMRVEDNDGWRAFTETAANAGQFDERAADAPAADELPQPLPDGIDVHSPAVTGPDGTVHVAARRGTDLLHLHFDDGTWHESVAAGDAVGDPSIVVTPDGEAALFCQTGRLTQLVARRHGDAWETKQLAESTVGRTAATIDVKGHVAHVVATTYGDLQFGREIPGAEYWARSFAIGTMATPDDEFRPDRFDQAREPDEPLGETDTVIVATVDAPATVELGFARDEVNRSLVRFADGTVQFETWSEGALKPDGGHGKVPFPVEPGDRVALVLTGKWLVAYAERGGVWHRVHTAVANGTDDLRDPAVRTTYRPTVKPQNGLRGVEVRERRSSRRRP